MEPQIHALVRSCPHPAGLIPQLAAPPTGAASAASVLVVAASMHSVSASGTYMVAGALSIMVLSVSMGSLMKWRHSPRVQMARRPPTPPHHPHHPTTPPPPPPALTHLPPPTHPLT